MISTFRAVVTSLMQSYAGTDAVSKPYPFDPEVLSKRDDLEPYWLPLEQERSAPLKTGQDTMTRTCKVRGEQAFLKCLDLTTSSNAAKADFVACFKEMMALQDDHIVKVLGISLITYSTTLCVAMEFMAQGSILNVVLNPKIELKLAQQWQMCLDTAKGLAYLHRAGRAHGSLCSTHVLVNAAGVCKLNVQAIVKPSSSTTAYGVMDLAFHAPETIRRAATKNLDASMAVDIYALAVIFQQIFARTHAFKSIYEEHGFVKGDLCIARAMEAPGSTLAPFDMPVSWPQNMRELVQRCLSHDPVARPVIADIVQALEAHLARLHA
ncbi:hypothetical protein ACHHYP_11836 [Achlya hypogyna]|uniref:Protein kinase domain-containing protein n=1 Tax=Achlya hypogyna TaxID=1202772 RepID=A0A1V9YI82_ACHHY|nr:hypothetical protein ACHHYP_11836 [Achlya hypogyna]